MKRRWRVFGWLGAWWTMLLASLGGCFVSRSGRVAAEAPSAEITWPERDLGAVRPLAEATPEEINRLSLAQGADPSSLESAQRDKLDEPEYRIVSRRLTSTGLLRVYDRRVDDSEEAKISRDFIRFVEAMLFGFTPNATFLTSRDRPDGVAPRRPTLTLKPDADGSLVIDGNDIAENIRLREGIDMMIPPRQDGPVRGVILHFTALFGNKYETRVLQQLREAGWVVFDINTAVGIRPPPVPEHLAAAEPIVARLREIREEFEAATTVEKIMAPGFELPRTRPEELELMRTLIDLRRPSFQACPGADLEALGREIAGQVDDLLAENAYAAEAVLEYIDAERPELAGKPLVVIGFSAGALATPAVCARLGDRVDAAILIGGAADLFAASQESTLMDGGIRIRCGHNFVDPRTIEAIHRAYLAHTTLDPIKTAPLLAATPTLVIRSDSDEWVPARHGRLLVEKLGKPDVQTLYGGGHMILFWRLPGRAPSILRWLDRVTVPPAASGDA